MKRYYIGVDLGGTSTKLGLFDSNGMLLIKRAIPTRNEDCGTYILPDIAEAIANMISDGDLGTADIGGIGIGVPGPVDAEGKVPHIANLGWGDAGCDAAAELSRLTGLKVAAHYLGKAIALLTTVLDPEIIVIGGGVSAAGDAFINRIREQYLRYCFRSTRNVRFELAELGNDAGIYGAAKLIIDRQ